MENVKIQPNTQAAIIQNMGFDPIKLGGKIIDGVVCKPDAVEEKTGKCMVCGTPTKIWVCGAGSYLCARHQDCY